MNELAIAKDVILAITGIIGSVVAIKGILTWKRQLRGRVEYDLARKLLTSTYKLRDSISYIRSPLMFGGEMEDPPENSPFAATEEGKRYYNSMTGYRKRFESANSVRAELLADIHEAEAVWGNDIRSRFNVLLSLLNELSVEIASYLDDKNPVAYRSEVPKDEVKRRMGIMYEMNDITKDPFGQRVVLAIEKIEEALHPKVK